MNYCRMDKREYQREWNRRTRQYRIENNLCTNCGKPLDTDGRLCESCRIKKRRTDKEWRDWYIEHGICPECQKNTLYGTERACPECRAKSTEQCLKLRSQPGKKEKYITYMREFNRSEYQRAKEQGICPRCKKRKPMPGKVMCRICLYRDAERKRQKSTSTETREEKMARTGCCRFCDRPAVDGYKVCEVHLEMNREKLKHPKCIEAQKNLKKIISSIFVRKEVET